MVIMFALWPGICLVIGIAARTINIYLGQTPHM
jgi:hypothetical protein